MDFKLDLSSYLENDKLKIDAVQFQKMLLLFNAVEAGWTLKKRKGNYVFTKSHEGKKEVVHESYLINFMKQNLDMGNIL